MKNVPVITFELEEADLVGLLHSIITEIKRWREECETEVGFAIATTGIRCPSFSQIETMAKEIALAIRQERKKDDALIVILETNMAKALGQALKREFPKDTPILCIDGISLNNGNYIDLGIPLASGCVIPVVVKTLVFEP
jgi:ethanolamine utilization protein EutA